MPRVIQITIPSEETDQLTKDIRHIPDLISLRVQRGISIQPPGDVISVETTNHSMHEVMRLLDSYSIGSKPCGSITTTEPVSIISSSNTSSIVSDTNESTWEEMELMIAKESNMTTNSMLVMAISGILAAIGIATNALHIVIGAMVIAPAFEPISRIALGGVAKGISWRQGLVDTGLGYVSMIAGAVVATLALHALGQNPLGGESAYLPRGVLISYWTTITGNSVIISAIAGAAGALLIATNRSILTAGVMIALALVPGAAIFGMGLASAEIELALQGLLRWIVDVGLVTVFSALVFLWNRSRVQRRDMLFK